MRYVSGLAVLIALCLWAGGLFAQSADYKAAFKSYRELNAKGRYGEAEPFARRALELAEQEVGPDHQRTGTLLTILAELYRRQGRLGEAEPLHKRSLAIQEKALGPDHVYVATTLNNLALLHQSPQNVNGNSPVFDGLVFLDSSLKND